MFQAFTQKLASQENYLTLGLFIRLSNSVKECRGEVEKIFEKIMDEPIVDVKTHISIPMNNPVPTSEVVEFFWNPHCFPRLDYDLVERKKCSFSLLTVCDIKKLIFPNYYFLLFF